MEMDTEMTRLAREVIKNALRLVTSKNNWAQGKAAVREDGSACSYEDQEAAGFGGYGSIARAAYTMSTAERRHAAVIREAALDLLRTTMGSDTRDLDELHHNETLTLFRRALDQESG